MDSRYQEKKQVLDIYLERKQAKSFQAKSLIF